MTGILGLNAIESAQEKFIRRFLQAIACFLFAHQSIEVITREGDRKISHKECLFCGRIV